MHKVIKFSQVVTDTPKELAFSMMKPNPKQRNHYFFDIDSREKQLKAQMLITEATEKASEILASAQKDASEIIEQAKETAKQSFEEAKAKGYNEGFEIGKEAGAKLYEKTMEEIKTVERSWLNDRKELINKAEKNLIELAICIAEKIVRQKLADGPELVLSLAKNGLERLKDEDSIIIRAGKQDYETLKDNIWLLKQTLKDTVHLGVVLDLSINPGDLIIESVHGKVYAGIGHQLEEIRKKILKN